MLGGRVALEYAVLATAREKNVASEVVAASLHGTTPAQQATQRAPGGLRIEEIC